MALGKLNFPLSSVLSVPRLMAQQNLKPLAVTHAHAAKVYDLPLHHRDPFGRLLIAQALDENLTIRTADREFKKYEVSLLCCGRCIRNPRLDAFLHTRKT